MVKTHKLISRAAECSIRIFMACKFDNNLEKLILESTADDFKKTELTEAWDKILAEYIDLSGDSPVEVEMMKGVVYLQARNKSIELAIWMQHESITKLGHPMFEGFQLFKKKGYKLIWNSDKDYFIQQLDSIKAREARFHAELDKKRKDLSDFRDKQKQGPEQEASRATFISMLNELQRFGYPIDKDKTTAEDLAVMIYDYSKLAKESIKAN